MAVPKRKTSKSRKGMRRSHACSKIKALNYIECRECGSYKIAHHVCNSCMKYRGNTYESKKSRRIKS